MYLRAGTNAYGFPDLSILPTDNIAGLIVRPGDILGRTKPGSPFEHTFMLGYDRTIMHSPGPGDVFRADWLQTVLNPGSRIRIVNQSPSIQETQRRFARAEWIVGTPWWNMYCHQTTDFIVASGIPWSR